jgi:ribokinase
MDPVYQLPPTSSTIVDTTGAGDCLAGWYLAEMIAGTAPHIALARAVLAATLSCSSIGAQTGYPTRTSILNHEHQEAQ